MTDKEAPKEIYLQWAEPDHPFGVCWSDAKENEGDVAYVRADVFDDLFKAYHEVRAGYGKEFKVAADRYVQGQYDGVDKAISILHNLVRRDFYEGLSEGKEITDD